MICSRISFRCCTRHASRSSLLKPVHGKYLPPGVCHLDLLRAPVSAISPSCAFSTTRTTSGMSTSPYSRKKQEFEAAYDKIKLKRERQEKAKNKAGKSTLEVWQGITVSELARVMQRPVDSVFEVLLEVEGADVYDTQHAAITDMTLLDKIATKAGFRPVRIKAPINKVAEVLEDLKKEKEIEVKPREPADPAVMVRRCPVVTIMGHVDHGKTTLLDALRHTSVVEQEFGGITQHIGAFSVRLPNTTETVTFLDTPGHAAFAAMRSRGAHITDIVVLVVAAEDGVMEQTKESIRFANAAKVPIIVAINKCDKPEANIEATKRGLWSQGIALEEFGGEVQSICISALKKTGLDDLIEAITTQAEVMQLKADSTGPVEAVVVESRHDQSRGRLCTAIIERGTLKKRCVLVAGTSWAKVRGMFDDKGLPIEEALPGTPVEVIGWRDLPSAGDIILECPTEQRAQQVVAYRKEQIMEKKMDEDAVVIEKKMEEHRKTYKEQLEKRRALGLRRSLRPTGPRPKTYAVKEGPELAIVLKADVDGSLEAIMDVLETYRSKQCRFDIIHYGVGHVTESDVSLAEPFKGIVYAFNVKALEEARKTAKLKKVEIRNFNIIYRLVEDLKSALTSQLPPKEVEDVVGEASVIQGFVIKEGRKKLPVAGCRCVKGSLDRKAKFKLVRGEEVIYDGPLTSMRHFKDEVKTIAKDQECGLAFDNLDLDFQLGDTIVCYDMKKVDQKIVWDPPGF